MNYLNIQYICSSVRNIRNILSFSYVKMNKIYCMHLNIRDIYMYIIKYKDLRIATILGRFKEIIRAFNIVQKKI